jgi:DNA mismatch repair protein MutL
MLSYAVAEAYQGLLMTGRHPIAVLNILLAPQEVDVNVHPAKSEVRFRQDRAVFAAVQKAVRGTLVGQAPILTVRARPQATILSPSARELISPHDMGRRQPLTEPLMTHETIRKAPEATIPILRVLGQIRNTYIIAEGPDGMYLIDQHTAHERVLFEKIRAERGGGKVAVQALLQPLTLELTARQAELLKERGESLSEYGFEVDPFGERTYLVRSMPALLKREVEEALRDILDSFDREGAPADWREGLAVSLSCHGAIKAGQTLSYEEMQELVRQLEQTELPRTCPHGRPTVIHLSFSQLEKEFGRA